MQDASSLSCFDEELELETQQLQDYEEAKPQADDGSQELVVHRGCAPTQQHADVVCIDDRSRLRRVWDSMKGGFSCFKGSED